MSTEPAARATVVREVLLVYGAVCVAVFGATRLRVVPALAEYVHLLVGGTFLFVALHFAGRRAGGLESAGIALGGLLGPSLSSTWRASSAAGFRARFARSGSRSGSRR